MLERDGTAPTLPWRAGARCAAAPPSGHPVGSGRSSCGRSGGTPRPAGPPRRPSTRPAGQRRTLASTDAFHHALHLSKHLRDAPLGACTVDGLPLSILAHDPLHAAQADPVALRQRSLCRSRTPVTEQVPDDLLAEAIDESPPSRGWGGRGGPLVIGDLDPCRELANLRHKRLDRRVRETSP